MSAGLRPSSTLFIGWRIVLRFIKAGRARASPLPAGQASPCAHVRNPNVRWVSHAIRASAGSLRASGCPCAARATALPATWAPSVVAGGAYLFIPLSLRVQNPYLAHSVCCSVTHAVPRVARLPLSGSCTRSERVRHKPLRGQRLSLRSFFFRLPPCVAAPFSGCFPSVSLPEVCQPPMGSECPPIVDLIFRLAHCATRCKSALRAPFLGRKNAPSPTLHPLNYPK